MCKPRPHRVVAFGALAAALLLSATVGLAATPLLRAGEGPEGKALYFWDVNRSWPGREQADARLDRPVRMWRTAIPLSEAFAQVREQTGAAVRCWPPGDQNERIRVNLYLNEQPPPSLRELMAQLAWVVDSSFACTEGEGRAYYLLSTTLGEGLAKDPQAMQQAWRAEQAEQRKRALAHVRAKLDEYRAALGLTREEAISRYQESDPGVLVHLLEPSRRALVQFLETLSPEQLDRLPEAELGIPLRGESLPPASQALLAALLHTSTADIARATIYLELFGDGLGLSTWVPAADGSPDHRHSPEFSANVQQVLSPADEVALRRELGEQISGEQEQELVDQIQAERDRESTKSEQEEQIKGLRSSAALSEAAAGRLRQFRASAPVSSYAPHPLWLLQEAVARATGMHVVSDYLFDRGGVPAVWLSLLDADYAATRQRCDEKLRAFAEAHPEQAEDTYRADDDRLRQSLSLPIQFISALDLLVATAYGERPAGSEPNTHEPWALRGWEWGDAGRFLRFRSLCRDALRGAMWPESTLRRVNGWLDPYLAKRKPGDSSPLPRVPVTLRDLAWLAQSTDLELHVGAGLVYEDPSTAEGLLRADLRAKVCSSAMYNDLALLRFLGTLREEQWSLLQGPGLPLGPDVSQSQQERLPGQITNWAAYRASTGKPVPLADCVLKAVAMPAGSRGAAVDHYTFELWAHGKKQEDWHADPIQTWVRFEARAPAPRTMEPAPGD